jgi:hypothetical protein
MYAVSFPAPPLKSVSASSSWPRMMSSPLEALKLSAPEPPSMSSFSPPPAIVSLPGPAVMRSFCSCPWSTSLPGPPSMTSGSELPRRRLSSPSPPVSVIGPRKWSPAPPWPRPLK